jgi:dTDP-3,4-didehydro-2,6-dideoxy-alpha-D-glucose 3-reductase
MTDQIKILRIGVMGCAAVARNSMLPAINMVPQWNLVAVASREKPKAEELANQFGCEAVTGYENLLSRQDIDAIYMPLPTGLHHEWIMKTLGSGKHVLAEKSIAYDFKSAQQMTAMADSKRLVLMENFMFQYHSQHQFVFEMLKKKEIGDIRVFRASFGFPPLPEDNFRYNEKVGGGALLDAAGYTVRAAHFILGESLQVKASTLFYDPRLGTNIYGGAFLSNEKGVSAQLGFGFDHLYQCSYEIWGSRGKITVDRAFTPKPDYSPLIIVEKPGTRQEQQMKPDNHFIGSIKEFYRAIVEDDRESHYQRVLLQSRALDNIRSLSK